MDINFEQPKVINSQQTLVLILERYKYYFKPITEYDNTNFYCYIRHESERTFKTALYKCFKWAGMKKPELSILDCPLTICFCTCMNGPMDEPFVFSQEDVLNIITDVPDNYIGENIL